MIAASRLRQLLAQPDMVVAPGAFDAIGARAIEHARFPAVYMTGAGTSIARGYPDYGLLSMTEMVENAGVIARSVEVPVIADADTGFGNELNVTRTVREYEARDVAAIHIEDQVSPKRCGHLDGKEVVSQAEFVAKIRAASAARRSAEFVIIARTDARGMAGLDEAVARVNAALATGADMAFIEAAQTMDEMQAVPKLVRGPCLLNIVPGGRTPNVALKDAQAMGYRLAILPGLLIKAAIEAYDAALSALAQSGMPPAAKAGASPLATFRRFGADEWDQLRSRFQSEFNTEVGHAA